MSASFVSYVTFLVNAVTSGQTAGITVEAPPGPQWLASPPAGPYSMSVEGETISFTSFSATAQGGTVLAGVTRGAAVNHPAQAVTLMSVGHFNPPPVTTTPTLQQVTDAGNTTTNEINVDSVEVSGIEIIDTNGELFYPSGSNLSDISGNLYWGNGNILAENNAGGFLHFSNGAILADIFGTMYYSSGPQLANSSGNLYYGNSDALCDAAGNLYYGSGSGTISDGVNLFYSSGPMLADSSGHVYGDGSNLTNLVATHLVGLVPTANLGTGSASSTTFLTGAQTYVSINQAFPITSANLTGQTTAVSSIATLTPGVLGTYRVGAYINVTAISVDHIQVQCTFKDETGTNQTITLSGSIATTGITTISSIDIRAASGAAIVIKTTLLVGGGSITYDVGATIQQLN